MVLKKGKISQVLTYGLFHCDNELLLSAAHNKAHFPQVLRRQYLMICGIWRLSKEAFREKYPTYSFAYGACVVFETLSTLFGR